MAGTIFLAGCKFPDVSDRPPKQKPCQITFEGFEICAAIELSDLIPYACPGVFNGRFSAAGADGSLLMVEFPGSGNS